MQVLLLPRVQFMVMPITLLKLAEPSGVGYFTAIAMLYSQVMVEHLVVNDAHDDIPGHVALIQRGMDANYLGSVRVTGKLNRILVPDPPVGSPGDRTINLVCEVFAIDLVKQSIEIEEASLGAHFGLLGPTRRFLYLM